MITDYTHIVDLATEIEPPDDGMLITIMTNDLIWWMPFASILYLAFKHNTNTSHSAVLAKVVTDFNESDIHDRAGSDASILQR